MSAKSNYEMVFVLHPNATEDELNVVVEKIKQHIVSGGGEVISLDAWGKRRMAYMIRKVNDGYYNLLKMSMPSTTIPELERNLKLIEPLLRYLIIKA